MKSLVEYSSSSDSEDAAEAGSPPAPSAKKMRLPLPSQIKTMKLNSIHEVPVDDPSKHDGRVRSFQHERGNWATFVYVPVDVPILDDLQNSLIKSPLIDVELKPSSGIHISLTKTVVLQHHWIDSFVSSVRNELVLTKKFRIQFQHLKVYCNEDRTRTFIGLKVNSGMTQQLDAISKRLDTVLKEYRLPEFYKDPSFHCSILWCAGDHETKFNAILKDLETIFQSYFIKSSEEFQMAVNTILCKTGNKLFRFELS
ncbi:unnamed protein product [Hermetia illucens]|uniref:U6 snRNA phosphodiesterase n=1 Tax=Hermetia illucens TaxID=343691 RepID=A0A7R8V3F5_HERIL|nr:U6 snRNA phosphodiesterase [Hermetia illucens]CAD7092048.1 unnamed protein product [Hermetia illucens]